LPEDITGKYTRNYYKENIKFLLKLKMIYIPFEENTKGIGGPSTFMRNLRQYLIKVKYPFIEDKNNYKEADSVFFPISYNKRILNYFKNNGFPIIQRLDGVYYPSKHGIKYLYYNREIKLDYLKFSDFIIFQSKYSRLECFTIMGEIPKDKYKIIYNGTDKAVFYSIDKNFDRDKIIFTTTGSFRSRDMIEPAVLALDRLNEKYNIEFKVIGPIINSEVRKLTNRGYIRCLGKMNKEEIAKELQATDIFIYCQLNPPCPNSVIEAISCGLPVVGFDSGAMKELLYFAPELLAYVSDEVFSQYKDYKFGRLLKKIVLCIDNYKDYKSKFVKYSNLYDFKDTYREYIEVFESVRGR